MVHPRQSGRRLELPGVPERDLADLVFAETRLRRVPPAQRSRHSGRRGAEVGSWPWHESQEAMSRGGMPFSAMLRPADENDRTPGGAEFLPKNWARFDISTSVRPFAADIMVPGARLPPRQLLKPRRSNRRPETSCLSYRRRMGSRLRSKTIGPSLTRTGRRYRAVVSRRRQNRYWTIREYERAWPRRLRRRGVLSPV